MDGSARFARIARSVVLGGAFFARLAASAEPDRRVDPQLDPKVTSQILRASSRLARPGCGAVVHDFDEVESGRRLAGRLRSLGMTAAGYLSSLTYRKAPEHGRCGTPGVVAYTTPGASVIWVCAPRLFERRRDDVFVSSVLIHEMLHSLGLRENPPSSREITARIQARCGGG